MPEKLMTVAQAAEQCECCPRTLRRAIDTGQLAAIRLGLGPKSEASILTTVDPDTRLEMRLAEIRLARKTRAGKATKASLKMPTKKSSKKPV